MVVRLLAATLGEERARGAWADAVKGLAIPLDDSYDRDQAASVLTALANAPGLVGNASRIARGQLDGPTSAPDVSDEPPPSSSVPSPRVVRPERRLTPASGVPSSATVPIGRVDVLAYLVPSLGDDKAREVLQQYSKKLGVRSDSLSRDDAVALLEAMTTAEGLLGVVAQFAKARFLLKHPASRTG